VVRDLLAKSIALSAEKTPATAEAGYKKRHSYKPLPTQFRHGGFEYTQITRDRNAAIYEQIWNGCSNPSISYEIIRIRRREGFEIGGRFVEPAEVYPNSEAWGVDGWTAEDKKAAFRKLQTLVIERARTFPAKRSGGVSSQMESE
jgi:hypothetical protein